MENICVLINLHIYCINSGNILVLIYALLYFTTAESCFYMPAKQV